MYSIEPVKKKLSSKFDIASSATVTIGEATFTEASCIPLGEFLISDYVIHGLPTEIASSNKAYSKRFGVATSSISKY